MIIKLIIKYNPAAVAETMAKNAQEIGGLKVIVSDAVPQGEMIMMAPPTRRQLEGKDPYPLPGQVVAAKPSE